MGYRNNISIMVSDKDKNEFEQLLSQYNYLKPKRSICYNKHRVSVGYVYEWKWVKWNPMDDYTQDIEGFVSTHDAYMVRLGEEIDVECIYEPHSDISIPFYTDSRICLEDDWVDITSYIDTNTLTDDSPFIRMILDPIV